MQNLCDCGFAPDVKAELLETNGLDSMCVECLAAKLPDLVPSVVVKAAWLPTMTQREVSAGIRVLAYCAARPEAVRALIADKSPDGAAAVPDALQFQSLIDDDSIDFSALAEGLSDKEIDDKIKQAAVKRMSDVFLSAVDHAVELFGSSDVSTVRALIEANPKIRSDADYGLRVVPLTFDQERMIDWPMESILSAAKKNVRSR